MDKLKTIEPKIGFKFEANGKSYVIEDKLSIARSIEASKLELELFDINTKTLKNLLTGAYNDLNGNNKDKTVKFADASIKIHNLVTQLNSNINFKDLAVLRYCALYINAKDEDRRTISKEIIESKINDWQEAGYEISGFFLLVLSALPHVKKEFVKYMDHISNVAEQKKKEN